MFEDLKLPKIGSVAPDFELPATNGRLIRLSNYPKPVALVFLRHLA